MRHHLSGGRTGSGIKALSQDSFSPASAPYCYFSSLLSHLKPAWVERAWTCWSCSRAVFFPCFFQGYSGPGTLGLLFWLTKCLEQREQGKPSGNISEEGKKEFWEFPPDRSFIRFYSHGSGVRLPGLAACLGRKKARPARELFFPGEILSKPWLEDRGKKGWEVPFPSARNGAGTGTSQQLFLSAVKGRNGLNFLTTGIFWSFPKSDEDWAELEWEGEKVGEHRGVCGVGNAKGCVYVLHMEHTNWGAQEALISPDVAKIK